MFLSKYWWELWMVSCQQAKSVTKWFHLCKINRKNIMLSAHTLNKERPSYDYLKNTKYMLMLKPILILNGPSTIIIKTLDTFQCWNPLVLKPNNTQTCLMKFRKHTTIIGGNFQSFHSDMASTLVWQASKTCTLRICKWGPYILPH